jgi:uncharacterized protein DUF5666
MRNADVRIVRGATTLAGLALVCLVGVSAAMAHGSQKHVLGTVTELDATHLVVETSDGKTESILRNADTKYVHGEKAAAADDLKVGDRVVVHASPAGNPPTAKTIRFSSPKH